MRNDPAQHRRNPSDEEDSDRTEKSYGEPESEKNESPRRAPGPEGIRKPEERRDPEQEGEKRKRA